MKEISSYAKARRTSHTIPCTRPKTTRWKQAAAVALCKMSEPVRFNCWGCGANLYGGPACSQWCPWPFSCRSCSSSGGCQVHNIRIADGVSEGPRTRIVSIFWLLHLPALCTYTSLPLGEILDSVLTQCVTTSLRHLPSKLKARHPDPSLTIWVIQPEEGPWPWLSPSGQPLEAAFAQLWLLGGCAWLLLLCLPLGSPHAWSSTRHQICLLTTFCR